MKLHLCEANVVVYDNNDNDNLLYSVADVYCNNKAGAQDKKGAAAEDTAAGKRHSEAKAGLTWRPQEEMLLTCQLSLFYC